MRFREIVNPLLRMLDRIYGSKSRRVLSLLLATGIVIQMGIIIGQQILPLERDIRRMRDMPAWERAARLSFGDEFADYVMYLRTSLPQDAKLVVPPREVSASYGDEGIMQYLLFPRTITNCPRKEEAMACLELFNGRKTYILYVDGFPAQHLAQQTRELWLFNDHLGVFTPPK